ncbi:ATP-binding protein [Burkholderiaceae bacterium FT117]|uniref:sensor histidine kinase n=1 Tax=Zeimonas sediminis TaxID=2944268 RepID=UPI002342D4D8|nr:ATP-binding protein [Zeimonas sediminis]MCM5571321.1 ATP-binding protein [Zeimonas sediminis]
MEAIQVQADAEKRAVGRILRFALIGAVALALVLLVLLAGATANTRMFERYYAGLLWLTVGVAAGLFLLVLELVRRLVLRYRRRLFGTRLMARMAVSFTLMTIVPVALIYLVAVQFVGRSVESWFAVPVERALDSGLALGRSTLDAMLTDLSQRARSISAELVEAPERDWANALNRLREQSGVQDALIVSGTGRIVAASGNRLASLVPDLPPANALRQARLTRQYAAVEPGEEGKPESLKLRVILVIGADRQLLDDSRYLQLVQAVPPALAENAEAVDRGRRDFQALQLSRDALLRLYRVTLTLIFLLTAFAAIAASFLLAGWLTGPLSMLAAGTRAVAEGDFRPVKDYSGRDELGMLTQSFNVMTRQLEEARLQVDRNQRELERANARLESVLANLTAGVLVLDSDFRLVLANAGAERILGLSMLEYLDLPLAEVPRLGALAGQVRAAFDEQVAAGDPSWQRQFVLPLAATVAREAGGEPAPDAAGGQAPAPAPDEQTILARGSILPERRVGYVIVFDDISGVISAQRAVAWAEVARRLAHEIKNPLTPIQLAAERLQRKLADRLPPADAELLAKNSQTIVNQVAALKHMVDEFRDYARLPAARLAPLDLNALIEDVLRLYPGGEGRAIVEARLAEGLPRVMGDTTQLRQVIHNLLKNAQEATERVDGARILVETGMLARADGGTIVRVCVSDNGSGFPAAVLARVFEPYVTSKARGTGLGLAIVRKIADEHGARVEVGNLKNEAGETAGARIAVLFTKLAKNGENPGLSEKQHD